MRSAQSIFLLTALSGSVGFLAYSQPAHATLTYNIYEDSGNVVIETLGTLTLPAPSGVYFSDCGTPLGGVLGSAGIICTGPNANTSGYAITGPTSFTGPSSFQFGSSTSGISTVLYGGSGVFTINPFTSGDPIVATTTFIGKTLAGMGFTTMGTIGTWTINGTSETIQVNVGNPVSSVPGPLPFLGGATAIGFSRRLRRRIAHRQS